MKLILITLLCTAAAACGSNILVVMPFPTYSHMNAFLPIIKELANRGHNVTTVSPYPLKKPIPNYRDIILTDTKEKIMHPPGGDSNKGGMNLRALSGFTSMFIGLWALCPLFLDAIFELPEFQEFLNDKDLKFDLVILEPFFCQQPFLAFGHKYGAPVVSMVSSSMSPRISAAAGNSHPLAYIPNLKLKFTDHMTFWERAQNAFVGIVELFVDDYYGNKLSEKYGKEFSKYTGFENLPSISKMQNNISLFLVDNDFSFSHPRPYLPNIVEFGGLSVKSGGEMPADLQKFMNESKEGVIFFTWGSHYNMTNMPPVLLSSFMSVFRKLKQRVLMKWETETLPGKPDNVKIGKWFPQASILSHPNMRLFITHGGIHGLTETIFNAVPILGTPIFGDQHFNLKMAEQSGYCITVDIDTVTEEQLNTAINKLLNDPKYKENAKKKSMIFRDRPMNTLDQAVYWIEYVLRHNGARHLRPGSLDLEGYQNWLLDVIALFIAIIIAFVALFIYSLKLICKLFKKGNKSRNKGDKKNKKE
ncbi:UDP-glycosyltransferase UGT4 [Halyomorpha halys]|uniref:UDP-glycosyltransferase UGT4 n=1 Tax=Halyomorpha halys TaxID=286706 RepID=UPI0006D4F2FD|nr:UDP-glucuronosyltransferase 2C1 [Halyomorpha halys]